MDYEKKYFEALNLMKSLYSTLDGEKKEKAERVFPELKDAKKEAKIIRAIARVLDENHMDSAVIEGVEIAEIKAWLEEQKMKMNINANVVIEWLQSFGIEIPTLIKSFKNQFGV